MGVIKIIEIPEGAKGILGIWQMDEDCNDLLQKFQFSEKEQAEFQKINSEKRKCEFLAVRLLLQNMMQKKKELHYKHSGKPFLEENLHISISHSSELVVILLTDITAGVDVESLQRQTDKIASRFLSDSELENIDNSPNPAFTRILYWCAKEALFKCTSQEEIEFKSHILIDPFLPADSGKFSGRLLKNNQISIFDFHYFIVKKNTVVYCIEKENRKDNKVNELNYL